MKYENIIKLCIFAGKSKKRAKVDAARQALISIIGENAYEFLVMCSPCLIPANQANVNTSETNASPIQLQSNKDFYSEDPNVTEYDLTFSDYICRY